MKEKIRNWWDWFKIDPVFNTIMYIACTGLTIIMFILLVKCFIAVWNFQL